MQTYVGEDLYLVTLFDGDGECIVYVVADGVVYLLC